MTRTIRFVVFFRKCISCRIFTKTPSTHLRWVMPFSRQFFLAAIAFTPLVPWDVKMKGVEVRRGEERDRK